MGPFVRLLSVLTVAVLAAGVAGQSPPTLAGKWSLVAEPSLAIDGGAASRIPGTAGSGWGQQFTIAQDARMLAIERAQFSPYDMQAAPRFVYALDGSESRNVVNLGRGPQEQLSRAFWREAELVITTRHAPGTDLENEVTHVFRIDEAGALVIETTRPRGATPASKTTSRYRRG